MSKSSLDTLTASDAAEIEKLVSKYESGIALVPQPYGSEATTSLASDVGDFAKWLKQTNQGIDVHLPADTPPRVLLRSSDCWLSLVWLGANVALPIFLGIVSNYLYDKAKGGVKGEKVTAHVEAVYRDPKTGAYKKFKFEGDVDQLKAVVKKFDPNEFMNGDEK